MKLFGGDELKTGCKSVRGQRDKGLVTRGRALKSDQLFHSRGHGGTQWKEKIDAAS